MEFTKIPVYTDGRPECARGLRVRAALAKQAGRALTVLEVADAL